MKLKSKPCPHCEGRKLVKVRWTGERPKKLPCPVCWGTGVFPKRPDDSRKRAIPQVLSRRRSLPALVKVRMQVTRIMCEARRAGKKTESEGNEPLQDFARGQMDALFKVLEEVWAIEREEPEGNTESSDSAPTDTTAPQN